MFLIQQWVNLWKKIGYGLRSSKFLVRRIVHIADIADAKLIVELGAGEGQVTAYLIEKKSKDTRLIVIENDHDRFIELQSRYGSQCEVHEISAAHIDTILPAHTVDVVISTLPLGSISPEGVEHILRATGNCLKRGGKFIQYQYWMANKKDIKRHFHIKKISWEPRNIGPAFIYTAYKSDMQDRT